MTKRNAVPEWLKRMKWLGRPARAVAQTALAVTLVGAASLAGSAPAAAQGAGLWLDQATLPRWNQAGAPVPAAPPPASPGPGNPNCAQSERAPETAEDRQVAGAGWRLFREYQTAGLVKVIWALSDYDGMCRPLGYQVFAFADGTFAGTLAPQPMGSREDGSLQEARFVAPSASAGALATLSGVFNRYEPDDPLCCPSHLTTVGFQVLVPEPGQSSVLVATRAATSPSAPLRPGPSAAPGATPATPAPAATPAPQVTPAPGTTPVPQATPVPGATSAPGATPVPGATPAPGTYTASYQGISFTFRLTLARWVEWQVVPATPVEVAPALGGGAPQHVLFSFVESPQDPAAALLDPRRPQLRVFPVEGLRALEPGVAKGVDDLRALLAVRPATPGGESIPVFPPPTGSQVVKSQVRYLDFPGGAGIAFVTAYGQDVSPLTRDRTLYTFQGLTQDGQSYVSLVWPVETRALPSTYDEGLAGQSYDAFAQQYSAYLVRTTQTLDTQAPAAFAPDLSLLDGLLRSLRVTAS